VVEYVINTLQYVSMEMLVNEAAKLRYMTGGQVNIPMTVLIDASGAGQSSAAQHSDSTWAQLIHMGVKVAVPSCAYDMKGLLKAAIREDDPVVIYLPALVLANKDEIPDGDYTVPIGKGKVCREGTDLTLVAVGHLVPCALEAAEKFAQRGISVEVIDPRTLYPLDKDLILSSVRKTGRLLVADDGYRFCSFSSEVAAIAADEAFTALKAPVKRVTRPMVYVPYSKKLEWETFPFTPQLEKGIADVMGV
jgi:pyruvate/2-oxoglutarate/acetoin dehydrogenase E1 component